MAEYIDKQTVLDMITEYEKAQIKHKGTPIPGFASIAIEIEDLPAADVRKNVKGEWLHVVEEIEGTTFRGCRCSKCNYWKGMGIFNFCPNCGAYMQEEKDG